MLDLTNLQNEVIDHWENTGVVYFETQNNGFKPPDPTHYETTILPEFEAILSDPMECLDVLGFESIASYIAERRNAKN
jgi:hypothetical protein